MFLKTEENLEDISLGKPTVVTQFKDILGSTNFMTCNVH